MLRYVFCLDKTAYWSLVFDLEKDFPSVLSEIKEKKIIALTSQNLEKHEKKEIEKLGVKLVPEEIYLGNRRNKRIIKILRIQQ